MSSIRQLIAHKTTPFFLIRQQISISPFAVIPPVTLLTAPSLTVLLLLIQSRRQHAREVSIRLSTVSLSAFSITKTDADSVTDHMLRVGHYIIGDQNDSELYGHPDIRY